MKFKASDIAACSAILVAVLGLFVHVGVLFQQAPARGLAVIAVAGVMALASIALALNDRGNT